MAHSRNCFRSSCIAAVALRFLIAQTAAAWVGVTTTALQELEVQQVELTQARKLLRDVGDVARNTANAQRETMGLARDQARIGEDTLRLRRELQDFQNQMRAERAENTRAAEELSGSKAARRHAPSVPSTPGMSTANRGIYASMVTVRFGSVRFQFSGSYASGREMILGRNACMRERRTRSMG